MSRVCKCYIILLPELLARRERKHHLDRKMPSGLIHYLEMI